MKKLFLFLFIAIFSMGYFYYQDKMALSFYASSFGPGSSEIAWNTFNHNITSDDIRAAYTKSVKSLTALNLDVVYIYYQDEITWPRMAATAIKDGISYTVKVSANNDNDRISFVIRDGEWKPPKRSINIKKVDAPTVDELPLRP